MLFADNQHYKKLLTIEQHKYYDSKGKTYGDKFLMTSAEVLNMIEKVEEHYAVYMTMRLQQTQKFREDRSVLLSEYYKRNQEFEDTEADEDETPDKAIRDKKARADYVRRDIYLTDNMSYLLHMTDIQD